MVNTTNHYPIRHPREGKVFEAWSKGHDHFVRYLWTLQPSSRLEAMSLVSNALELDLRLGNGHEHGLKYPKYQTDNEEEE